MYLAQKYNLRCVGTVAHEWIMAIAELNSLNHPNLFALDRWFNEYTKFPQYLYMLTDTYGTNSFLDDFKHYAKQYSGVRHDSSCPYKFIDKIVNFYKSNGINTKEKTIVFSDGLNLYECIRIRHYCNENNINCAFGVGTSLTNDFEIPPLNIVIKLNKVNDNSVCKLSDVPGKVTGDSKLIEIMRSLHVR